MRRPSLVLLVTAGLGGVAVAQPLPTDTTEADTSAFDPAPPAPEPPPPPPPPAPAPAPAPAPQPAPVVQEQPAVSSDRPQELSIGLGIGYALPTSLETPNRTSARLRLPTGLTFEPVVTLANQTESAEAPGLPETENKRTEVGVALLVRLPVITHGKVDLEVLASAGFSNAKLNPEGEYNTITTNAFGIGWGVGIGYWLSRHWQLSMSVTNPLVTYAQAKQQIGPGMSTTESETTVGVIFVPQVSAMIHLYH